MYGALVNTVSLIKQKSGNTLPYFNDIFWKIILRLWKRFVSEVREVSAFKKKKIRVFLFCFGFQIYP